MNLLGMNFNELSHVVVFGVLLAYADFLSHDIKLRHGRGVGYAVLGAVVILPTVLLAMFKWKLAAAAWVVKTGVWAACAYDEKRQAVAQAKPNI